MTIGYARCSTAEQNLDWQNDELHRQGCERIFQEKVSGTKADRPQLQRMLDSLRKGDVVVVCELTRLGRSVKDLFAIVEKIDNAGANIRSLREPWLDTTSPQGRLLFTMFAGISQFERELTHQRTMEGLKAARARGHMGGRPRKDEKALKEALLLYDSKEYTVKEITAATGVSRTTLYEYINERKSASTEHNDNGAE